MGGRQEPRLDQMTSDLRVDVVVISQVKGDLAVLARALEVALEEEDARQVSGDGRSVVSLIERRELRVVPSELLFCQIEIPGEQLYPDAVDGGGGRHDARPQLGE